MIVTMTGVRAAAKTVPGCQISGTMSAAATLDRLAITSVLSDTPLDTGTLGRHGPPR